MLYKFKSKAAGDVIMLAANGELNVVYRRPDGNTGWIDPGRGNHKNGA